MKALFQIKKKKKEIGKREKNKTGRKQAITARHLSTESVVGSGMVSVNTSCAGNFESEETTALTAPLLGEAKKASETTKGRETPS